MLDELARTLADAGVAAITCVGDGSEPLEPVDSVGIDVRMLELPATLGTDELAERLAREVRIADAHSVIVLPRVDIDEPDSSSRLTCAAIQKACGDRVGPNVLVEINDPEAAFEFVGLGVATVFYSGHLRAALLGQACIDLGVFEFIVGLLRGRHRVRCIPVPPELRDSSFAEAALALETDERGRPMTVIGVAKPHALQQHGVVVNPGPRAPLRDVLGLMALVSGDERAGAKRA